MDFCSGATLTAAPWDGTSGGVLAFRAESLTVDGTIDASHLGYRGGQWSEDDGNCTDSVQSQAGESIGGTGADSPDANYGGSGGIVAGNDPYNGLDPVGATPAHATDGFAGGDYQNRLPAQEPGHAYGSGDGGTLTLGSGAGGNLTCQVNFPGPMLADVTNRAGGIVLIYAGAMQVSATGAIISTGDAIDSRTADTGGTVMIRGGTIDLGTNAVTALGAVEPLYMGVGPVSASPGYVMVFYTTSFTGTTNPPAFSQQVTAP